MENNEAWGELLNVLKNHQNTLNILNDKINSLDRKHFEQDGDIKELVKMIKAVFASLNSINSYFNCVQINKEKADYEMKMTLKDGFSGVFGGAERRS